MGPLDHKEDGTPVFGMSFAAHADEMCRFITPHKILLAEVTDEEAAASECDRESKRRLDAAYEILRNETDAEGQSLRDRAHARLGSHRARHRARR